MKRYKRKLIRNNGKITGWRPVGDEVSGEDVLFSDDPLFAQLQNQMETEREISMTQARQDEMQKQQEYEGLKARIAALEARLNNAAK